jgi:multimeric flavodoxin WrbA
MEITVLSGARSGEGQTGRAVKALVAGLEAGGAKVFVRLLPGDRLERCRQCRDDGWGECIDKGTCVIKDDDFAGIAKQVRKADAVVFATPVYWGDLAESLKAFLDRFRRTCLHAEGKKGVKGKPVMGLGVAGGGGGGSFECMRRLEDTLHHCGFDVVDLVPARRQNLRLKVQVLELTGKWFAEEVAGRQ